MVHQKGWVPAKFEASHKSDNGTILKNVDVAELHCWIFAARYHLDVGPIPLASDERVSNPHAVPSRILAKGVDRITGIRDLHNEGCEMHYTIDKIWRHRVAPTAFNLLERDIGKCLELINENGLHPPVLVGVVHQIGCRDRICHAV